MSVDRIYQIKNIVRKTFQFKVSRKSNEECQSGTHVIQNVLKISKQKYLFSESSLNSLLILA